jgi:hypothetical protein
MTQLWITIALLATLAFGSSAGVVTTNQVSKGINPVQHSE